MTDTTRRGFLGGAAAATAGVVLLRGGGRALARPTAALKPGDVPVTADPSGLSALGFMFPDLPPLRPDTDPATTVANLQALAASQLDPNVTTPAPGNRDNVGALGSVLTYWGQFVDHDNILDLQPQPTAFFTRSNQGRLIAPDGTPVSNNESFRFDLSSVYGGGPDLSPQLYEADKLHFKVAEPNGNGVRDLPRNPDGTAVLVEHRNDENEIISQVHLLFLKFHNAVADALNLNFADTRAMVIRYYQWAIIHEFLPEICGQDVVDGILDGSIKSFYKPKNPNHPDTPLEWSVAAYRFGHSIVRRAYEVTTTTGKLQVFNGTAADLHGGRPLPAGRQIDFGNFVTTLQRPENTAHFNFPRFTDTLISSGLFTLPIGGPAGAEASGSNVLAFRNLVRGFFYGLPSGQDVANAMGVPVIAPGDLMSRTVQSGSVTGFDAGTPLWFYILAESEFQGGLKLGTVGGRIVADVILGVLKSDKDGLLHDNSPQHGKWQPTPPIAPAAGQFGIGDMAVAAGVATRPGTATPAPASTATPAPGTTGTAAPTATPSGGVTPGATSTGTAAPTGTPAVTPIGTPSPSPSAS